MKGFYVCFEDIKRTGLDLRQFMTAGIMGLVNIKVNVKGKVAPDA